MCQRFLLDHTRQYSVCNQCDVAYIIYCILFMQIMHSSFCFVQPTAYSILTCYLHVHIRPLLHMYDKQRYKYIILCKYKMNIHVCITLYAYNRGHTYVSRKTAFAVLPKWILFAFYQCALHQCVHNIITLDFLAEISQSSLNVYVMVLNANLILAPLIIGSVYTT